MSDVDFDAWASAVVSSGGAVSNAQDFALQGLCVGLKADGVFAKLNFLWPLYTDSLSAALSIDIVTRLAATPANGPTYASKAGLTFDGSSQYLDLNTAGATSQNSASFGFDLATNKSNGDSVEMGTSINGDAVGFNSNVSVAWSDGNLYFALNDGNGDGGRAAPGTRSGLYAFTRTGAGDSTVYKDGSSFATNGQSSTAAVDLNFVLGAGRNKTGGIELFSPCQFRMAFIGDGLTGTDIANLGTRWATYKSDLAGFVDADKRGRVFISRQAVVRSNRY